MKNSSKRKGNYAYKDLAGENFGRLTVIKRVGINQWGNYLWLCKCECGKEHVVAGGKLIQGKTKSCGCYARDLHIKQLEKHGITTGNKPRTLAIWAGMKARCYSPKADSYKYYGARGITVCNEWLEYKNFHHWALENGYSEGLTIDRIDNSKGYSPQNCRWVTMSENLKHTTRIHYVVVKEITKSITDWAKEIGVCRKTMYNWLEKGEEHLKQRVLEHL